MGATWGSYEGNLRVGIECWTSTPSSSSTAVTVYLRVYVQSAPDFNFSDNQTITITGNSGGTKSYFNDLGPGGTKLVHSAQFNASIDLDGGPTYSWTATVSGMFNGGTPSHSRSLTLPARPAAAPDPITVAPTISSITATGCTASWPTPDNNGDALTQVALDVDTDAFTQPILQEHRLSWRTSQAITGLEKGTTYRVRVLARNSINWGYPWSPHAFFTTLTTAPSAPGTPSFSGVGTSGMTVSWSAPSDAGGTPVTHYLLDRATNSAFSSNLVTTNLSGTSLGVTGLNPGTTYYWRVRAVNATGTSGNSSSASQATNQSVPSAPGTPSLSNVTATGARVTYMPPASNGGSSITGYDVQWSTSPSFVGDTVTQADSASPYDITGFLPGETYYVRVRAKNALGAGAWSAAASTTTLSGVKVGNGTQWRDAVVYVGNGTSWVLASVKRGAGGGWA